MSIIKNLMTQFLLQTPYAANAKAQYARFGIDFDQYLKNGGNAAQARTDQTNLFGQISAQVQALVPPTPPTPPADPNDTQATSSYNQALLEYNQSFQTYHTRVINQLMTKMLQVQMNMQRTLLQTRNNSSTSTSVSASRYTAEPSSLSDAGY